MRLEIRDLACSYTGDPVLRGVSFSADAGQVLAVLGANGAGKTTLFRCILGQLRGFTGQILLDGQEVRSLTPRALAGTVAYIPQAGSVAPSYSVLSFVELGIARRLSPFSVPGEPERREAWRALEQVGMEAFALRRFDHLSGGEQQMVLIARALAQRSCILLMDEPTAHLDYGNSLRVLRQMCHLASEGYLILYSTHDPQSVLQSAHLTLALSEGQAIAYGVPTQILDEALFAKLYGVQVHIVDTQAGRFIVPFGEEAGQ